MRSMAWLMVACWLMLLAALLMVVAGHVYIAQQLELRRGIEAPRSTNAGQHRLFLTLSLFVVAYGAPGYRWHVA